jgi:Spy/CpxP family protein refolding chaperone
MDSMKNDYIRKMIMFLAVLIFGCAVAFAGPDSNLPVRGDKRPDARQRALWSMRELSEKLNLTDAQKAAIKPILANDANEIKAVRQDGSLSKEQKMAKVKEIRDSSVEQINAILTPDQQKEFAELRNEARQKMRENAGDRLAMLTKKLNLTDAQAAAIKPILAAEANDIKAVLQDKSLSKEQKQSKIFDIREAANKQINLILTPEQQAKWAELKEHAKSMYHKGMHPRYGQPKPADSNS